MTTTIQVGLDLLNKLQMMKIHKKESYEDIIWDLIEDRMELSEETKKNLKLSERDLREGKTISLEELKNKRRI
jgi:predicted CopG family antitoxin